MKRFTASGKLNSTKTQVGTWGWTAGAISNGTKCEKMEVLPKELQSSYSIRPSVSSPQFSWMPSGELRTTRGKAAAVWGQALGAGQSRAGEHENSFCCWSREAQMARRIMDKVSGRLAAATLCSGWSWESRESITWQAARLQMMYVGWIGGLNSLAAYS